MFRDLIFKMNRWIKTIVKVSKLYNKYPELVDNILNSKSAYKGIEEYFEENSEKEREFQNEHERKPVIYTGRNLPLSNSTGNIGVDVRNFINPYDSQVKEIVKKINPKGTDDQKAVKCLNWVINNISYKSDKKRHGLPEFWQFAFETLNFRKGDCEDGAILLANIMLQAGIPHWKIRLTAGYVKTSTGKGGHAYVTYYSEEQNKWVTLDWCYYPNKKKIKDREHYKDNPIYLNVWFSWNKKDCFTDIPGSKLETNLK